jgi:WD40 repeat protein
MEFLIAFVLIILVTIFIILINYNNSDKTSAKPPTKPTIKEENINNDKKDKADENKKLNDPRVVNNKEFLIQSFREGKELKNPKISQDGKAISFHDEKRVILCLLNNFSDKNPKFISKSVEQDVVCDVAFSEDPRRLVAALKNSKNLVVFNLVKEDGKQKLVKLENKVMNDDRKFEIKNVAFSKDSNYISTIGTGQDTVVQIFDVKTGKIITSLDINEIKNSEIKMTPDDRQLTISTFMYEIAVIEFKKTTKFKKEIEGDETIVKVIYIFLIFRFNEINL